jgi:hypothetical protein
MTEKLNGYRHITVRETDELLRVYNEKGANNQQLETIARELPFPFENKRAKTTDGYEWFAGLYFTTSTGETAVLFPWRKPQPDGKLEKPVRTYVTGVVSVHEVKDIVNRLTEGLRNK